jgi:hypothetical protein
MLIGYANAKTTIKQQRWFTALQGNEAIMLFLRNPRSDCWMGRR